MINGKAKLFPICFIFIPLTMSILGLFPYKSVLAATINVGGQITTNTTWTAGNVYVVRDHVIINSGALLTIQAGTIVKFSGNKVLVIRGALKVQGVAGNPVYFTSLKDDTIGGDTNNDGNASTPNKGDWGHISFLDGSGESLIEYAVIRYGGQFDNRENEAYPSCRYCVYQGSVRFDSAAATIAKTVVTLSNNYGLYVNRAAPNLICNDIFDNAKHGLYNETPNININAAYQWWGSTTGPFHATNPGGLGNAVTDGVNFTPWRSTPCQVSSAFYAYLPLIIRP